MPAGLHATLLADAQAADGASSKRGSFALLATGTSRTIPHPADHLASSTPLQTTPTPAQSQIFAQQSSSSENSNISSQPSSSSSAPAPLFAYARLSERPQQGITHVDSNLRAVETALAEFERTRSLSDGRFDSRFQGLADDIATMRHNVQEPSSANAPINPAYLNSYATVFRGNRMSNHQSLATIISDTASLATQNDQQLLSLAFDVQGQL